MDESTIYFCFPRTDAGKFLNLDPEANWQEVQQATNAGSRSATCISANAERTSNWFARLLTTESSSTTASTGEPSLAGSAV